ncbi:MAG: hypothetical protein E3J65_02730 [Dehalococcoidia bacterium]|nr:MAG: hypothetical protein E3J65_02730 [Dehalococcoidia bacterium]
MNVTLKYDYLKYPAEPSEAFPRRFSASRPVIPIRLIKGTKDVRYHAIIDSGADLCIFHAQIGEVIGLTIESGKLLKFTGISGQQLTAYFHDLEIEVGGYRFDCYAGFSREMENMPYGLLGQVGFFDLFNVVFDYEKQRIGLKLKNK